MPEDRPFTKWAAYVLLGGWAVMIHAVFIAAVPDPIFAPDSSGYVLPAFHRLFGLPFSLPAYRTPAYSLFLYAILKITHHFMGVLVVQHVLALVTGAGFAVLYYRYLWKSHAGAAVVFFLSSALPLPAVYAHYILTENLYGFFLMCSFLFLLANHERHLKWTGLMTGIAMSLAILTRPIGRALAGVWMAVPLLDSGRRKGWTSWLCGAAALSGVLLSCAFWNYANNGFLGLDRMGGIALFCCTARRLNPEKIEDARVKGILKPYYQTRPSRMGDGGWIYSSPEGPYQTLLRQYPPDQLNAQLTRLGVQAIRDDPLGFLYDRSVLTWKFLTEYTQIPLFYIIPEASYYVYQGILFYEEMAASDPRLWSFLRFGAAEADAYFAHVRYIPTGRLSGHLPYVPRSDADTTYHFDRVLSWWRPLSGLLQHMRWISLLAIMSFVILYRRKETRYTLIMTFLILVSHAFLSSMAGWQDSRFAFPILPLFYLLAVAGIQDLGWVLIDGLRGAKSMNRRRPL